MRITNNTTWRKVKLGEVAGVLGGFAFKSEWFNTRKIGFPSVKIQNISDGSVDIRNAEYVEVAKVKRDISKFKLYKGDFLVAMTGATAGKVGLLTEETPCYLNQRVGKFYSKNEDELDKKFLYYAVINPRNLNLLKKLADGSAQGNMSSSQIEDVLEILLPDGFTDQKRIAEVLSAFDDKIELNNKISRTLEQMAQAIFKEWFVNFRFPGHEKVKMVDSELGKIPEKWEVKSWGNLEGVSLAGDWGEDNANSECPQGAYILRGTDIPSLQSGSKGDCPIRYVSNGSLEKRKLKPGDIVIEISGGSKGQPTGRSIFITKEILNRFELPLICTSFCRLVRGNGFLTSILMYLHLDRLYRTKKIWNYQLQSTGISNFQYGQFREYERLVVPLKSIQEKITDSMNMYIEYGYRNENQKLTALRDLLLPKLMGGEIKV